GVVGAEQRAVALSGRPGRGCLAVTIASRTVLALPAASPAGLAPAAYDDFPVDPFVFLLQFKVEGRELRARRNVVDPWLSVTDRGLPWRRHDRRGVVKCAVDAARPRPGPVGAIFHCVDNRSKSQKHGGNDDFCN